MPRVANLGEGIDQRAFPLRLERNVEVDSCVGRWMAHTLPVAWNDIPGVLGPHVIPRYDRCREASEGSEKDEHREPEVSHKYTRSPVS